MYSTLLQSVAALINLSEDQQKNLTDRLVLKSISKNDYILNAGEICKGFHFINKGSFRQYFINDNEEVTINLQIENEWVFDHQSFTAQKPSSSIMVACEESEVLFFHMDEMHALLGKSPTYFGLGRILENGAHSSYRQDLQSTPEEKYLKLLTSTPQFTQRFPLKHIASYLGMTPETLSRVRKKIM